MFKYISHKCKLTNISQVIENVRLSFLKTNDILVYKMKILHKEKIFGVAY